MPHIILLGTLDTKRAEYLLARYAPSDNTKLVTLPRGEVIGFLIGCVTSGGTSLISALMRTAVPIGLPKLIVSTVASGATGPVVGECDITMMYSVLQNGAVGIFGMALAYQHGEDRIRGIKNDPPEKKKTRVGITMFGVTTPCVDHVYVFHATGHGGKAMECLVKEGRLDAILNITTTKICDLITSGIISCDTSRLEITLQHGVPIIISTGAMDMVNFSLINTVTRQYRNRNLQVHNPSVTLMRTSAAECLGSIGAAGSVSTVPDADAALAGTLQSGLKGTNVRAVSDERDINNDGFAIDIADRLMALVAKHSGS
ncbi:hypothetical protein BDV06DRAFT_214373 [Aspergillus oleicola]